MDKQKTINDFINFICNGDYPLINDFELMNAHLEYQKSFIGGSSETQAVRQNEAQKKPCGCGWSCNELYKMNDKNNQYICALGKQGD